MSRRRYGAGWRAARLALVMDGNGRLRLGGVSALRTNVEGAGRPVRLPRRLTRCRGLESPADAFARVRAWINAGGAS